MSETPILGITELEASQSQPELIVNKALRTLEALSPLIALSRSTGTPPEPPNDGDVYLVGDGSNGDWSNKDFKIAIYMATEWVFVQPRVGMLAYVVDEDIYVKYAVGSPTAWLPYP